MFGPDLIYQDRPVLLSSPINKVVYGIRAYRFGLELLDAYFRSAG